MRLDLANYQTQDIQFAGVTRWRNGALEVNADDVLGLVRHDPLVNRADLQIARPGEPVRITTIRDVVEPRVKVDGGGTAYPGILGREVSTVGSGRTNRLGGMTLTACAPPGDISEYGYLSSYREGTAYGDFVDMSGPGVVSPFGSLVNLCLIVEPASHLDTDASNRVVQRAMLTASDRIAEATLGEEPTEVESFDMTPTAGLPGFVYMHSILSPEATTLNPDSTLGTAVYGITRLTQPWFLGPTEVLDGAVCGNFGGYVTWPLTNSIVLHMCRRHGKDFNFLGCFMVRTMWEEQRQKQLMANRAALMASGLGADGAIVTPTVRGQRMVDTVLVAQACERAGIKTVLGTEEEDEEDGTAPPMLVTAAEVVAVVSTGDGSAPGPFPPVDAVIGAGEIGESWYREQEPPHGRYGTSHLNDVFGFSRLSCVDY